MTTGAALKDALLVLSEGKDLAEEQAAAAMRALIDADFTPAQFGAFAVALRLKGESATEIGGFLRVLRAEALEVDLGELRHRAVDMCGTGGDGPSARVFNISTTAAFVVAGAGVPVAKHGTNAVSSQSGSTDVLTALGVRPSTEAGDVRACLEEIGVSFMHAPAFNTGMRHLIGLRREIGLRFVFNLLGPLCNPARIERHVTGIYDRRYLPVVADALAAAGTRRAWVVHAEDGLDEVSTTAVTHVAEVRDGSVREFEIDARGLGLARATLGDLTGGDATFNAAITRSVLTGTSTRPQREIVLLNAAATLLVADRVGSLEAGLVLAEESLSSGGGADVLARWEARSARPMERAGR
ncbi:anthranilate phosphoribosyltransferase [Streptomyces sp. NPDC058964]|uniref:anthranilate phosphoribosyltransferase n=1 Tax=Streptomyces sp. NPDC058964 TaxID=3346681 RepID=UPI0036A652AF